MINDIKKAQTNNKKSAHHTLTNKKSLFHKLSLSLSLSLSLICFSNLEIIFYMTSYTNDVFVNRPYEYQTIPLYNLFFLHVDDA